MRFSIALTTAAAAISLAGAANAASVEVKDAVARVTVIPENRGDIKVEIIQPNARLPLQVRSMGDRVIVDGDLDRRIRNCRGSGENRSVDVRGVGDIGWRDIPQVVIRTPRDARVEAGGAVFGAVGRSASLTLTNAGCGDWTVANVEGEMKIRQAGSGDTRTGSAGSASIRVAGSGAIATADIRGGLDVDIAGSGDVTAKSVQGPLDVNIAGSGDVSVAGGRATTMKASIAGSGDIDFRGTTGSLKARIAGSGDIRAREVKGEVSKSIMGSGAVTIG
ncbi:GIN domain-containing protein [Phenylobacterium sp. VNQ135]|uniref:GIN domain-containing protein n=1 Tax=Phenylobacterium sp. VNQ135 TaxID=3400922 RepID=UPI003C06ECA4